MSDALANALVGYGFRLGLIALSLVLAYAALIGKQYLVARIGETKFNTLYKKAEIVVRSLEQAGLLPKWTGAYKKQVAMVVIGQIANSLGVFLTDQEKSDLIESIVQIMNTEAGKFVPKLEPMTFDTATVGEAEG